MSEELQSTQDNVHCVFIQDIKMGLLDHECENCADDADNGPDDGDTHNYPGIAAGFESVSRVFGSFNITHQDIQDFFRELYCLSSEVGCALVKPRSAGIVTNDPNYVNYSASYAQECFDTLGGMLFMCRPFDPVRHDVPVEILGCSENSGGLEVGLSLFLPDGRQDCFQIGWWMWTAHERTYWSGALELVAEVFG